MKRVFGLCCFVFFGAALFAQAADRLIVKDGSGNPTFKVEDDGAITTASRFYANGAGAWGAAPMVLGQVMGNRGIVITDKAAANPKNLYLGWDTSLSYVSFIAVHEGTGYKNIVLNPTGGNVGIRTTNPQYPLHLGNGAYCSAGGTWTNASSRELKDNIMGLSSIEAMSALADLRPVKFVYRADTSEQHVGFIAEDVPELVATKDRKGLSSLDVAAVLTKVVQEQQKLIESQRKALEELNYKLGLLEKMVRLQSEVARNFGD